MIRESNGIDKVEFSGCLGTESQRSQETEKLWEYGAESLNTDDKAAAYKSFACNCIR